MSTKKLCINAMGIALFVAVTLCLQVPVFENYYVCLGYIIMAFYLYYFGTASGILAGTAGVFIYCMITGGLAGMPGWILGNAVIGIICGTAVKQVKKLNGTKTKQTIMILTVIIAVAIGILGVKSIVEVALYALPFVVRLANNIYAFTADVIVLIIGFTLCITGEGFWTKIIGDNYERL